MICLVDVSQVIMMGVPKNSVSYMHRAGRAGRMRVKQSHQQQDTKPFPPGIVTLFITPEEESGLKQIAGYGDGQVLALHVDDLNASNLNCERVELLQRTGNRFGANGRTI